MRLHIFAWLLVILLFFTLVSAESAPEQIAYIPIRGIVLIDGKEAPKVEVSLLSERSQDSSDRQILSSRKSKRRPAGHFKLEKQVILPNFGLPSISGAVTSQEEARETTISLIFRHRDIVPDTIDFPVVIILNRDSIILNKPLKTN